MARPSLRRVAVAGAISLTLAGCAEARPPKAPAPPGPYEVPSQDGPSDRRGPPGPVPVTSADPSRGDPLAPVTIVEFADFQCPFCQRGARTLMDLQREYGPSKIRVVWKNYPLPFHRNARGAAEAGVVLFQRVGPDAFWSYHDAIFTSDQGLGQALFDEAVARAGYKPEDVRVNLRDGRAARKVDEDAELGRRLGVTGTPSFFVNGVLVHGAQPIERFRPIIDAQLQAARAASAAGTPPERVYATLSAQNFVAPPPAQPAGDDEEVDRTVYRVPVGSSPARGPATAPITIVEFADFQCPYCARAEESVRRLSAEYGDKVRVVWKNLPLPFHDRARPAAELAAEAMAQKGEAGFWKVHDLLLAQRGQLDDADLDAVARAAGLDPGRAAQAIAQHRYLAAIEEDLDLAEDAEADGTPTFYVNGRKLVGARPFSDYKALVDEQLAVAQAALAKGVAPAALYETLQAGARAVAPETATVPAPTAASPSRGPLGAKVVVQIWSDLECPFCKRVEPTLAELEAAFPGKIRLVWHNLPLSIHPDAMAAAEAAMEAYAQKGNAAFWRLHDLILENQGDLDRASLEKYAARVGLDMARFRAALDGGKHRAAIVADMKLGAGAGLRATPGFVINGYRLSGALPLHRFKKVVRRALAEAK